MQIFMKFKMMLYKMLDFIKNSLINPQNNIYSWKTFE